MRTPTIWVALAAAGILSGCDSSSSNTPTAEAANAVQDESHNWIVHEGGEYGYGLAITKDQKDAGQAAGEVLMYRYLGVVNGAYELVSSNAPGIIASCTNPCTAIKLTDTEGDVLQRFTFNPESVIGSAFSDAFDGKLQVYQAPTPVVAPAPVVAAPAPTPPTPVANPAPASGDPRAAVPADSPPPAAPNEQATTNDQPTYQPSWQPPPGSPAYRPPAYPRPTYRPYPPPSRVPY